MKRIKSLFMGVWVSALVLTGWHAKAPPPLPEQTQLEIRQAQTRTYDLSNINVAMRAVLNALQDEGFIIKEANHQLGFINATKDHDIYKLGYNSIFFGQKRHSDKRNILDHRAVIEGTANISTFGEQTRIRLNFSIKTYSIVDTVWSVQPVSNPECYQHVFSKIDKRIFLEQADI